MQFINNIVKLLNYTELLFDYNNIYIRNNGTTIKIPPKLFIKEEYFQKILDMIISTRNKNGQTINIIEDKITIIKDGKIIDTTNNIEYKIGDYFNTPYTFTKINEDIIEKIMDISKTLKIKITFDKIDASRIRILPESLLSTNKLEVVMDEKLKLYLPQDTQFIQYLSKEKKNMNILFSSSVGKIRTIIKYDNDVLVNYDGKPIKITDNHTLPNGKTIKIVGDNIYIFDHKKYNKNLVTKYFTKFIDIGDDYIVIKLNSNYNVLPTISTYLYNKNPLGNIIISNPKELKRYIMINDTYKKIIKKVST